MTNVTHQQLNDKLEKQVKVCDNKIKQQTDYRHELANDVTTNLFKMTEKIEKILVLVTHNADNTKHLYKSYEQLWKDFKEHAKEEEKDRKSLLTKEMFFWATWILWGIIFVTIAVLAYLFISSVESEKRDIKLQTTQSILIEQVKEIQQELK